MSRLMTKYRDEVVPALVESGGNIDQVAGVACITVGFTSSTSSASQRTSAAASALAICTVAPTISGPNSSSTAISNDNVVSANNESSMTRPGHMDMLYSRFNNCR